MGCVYQKTASTLSLIDLVSLCFSFVLLFLGVDKAENEPCRKFLGAQTATAWERRRKAAAVADAVADPGGAGRLRW